MKLLSLKINDSFRSLQKGFEIEFNSLTFNPSMVDFQPFCFVGLNGSGKSNVLEALSSIFYYLECCYPKYLPTEFTKDFNPSVCSPNAFVLEYVIKSRKLDEFTNWQEGKDQDGWGPVMQHVRITKEKNKNHVFETKPWFFEWEAPSKHGFGELKGGAQDLLPELVVGYSSGENEILSLPFFKTRFLHFDEYLQGVKDYEKYTEPSNSLVYIDNTMSQAVMLTNFLFFEKEVLAPFHDRLEIEKITEFRIIIRNTEKVQLSEEGISRSTPQMGTIQMGQVSHGPKNGSTVNLTQNLEDKIELLKKCATCWFVNKIENEEELILDFLIEEATCRAFQENFVTAFGLFRTFQMLITLNLFNVEEKVKKEVYSSDSLYVNETIPLPPSDKRIFRFKNLWIKKENIPYPILSKNLSDGEHQFLHIIGISILIQNKTALFLLDEPETHFNPDWRSVFISTLRDCVESSALEAVRKEESELEEIYQQMKKTRLEEINMMREFLITSHSPFIISDCKRDKVKIFKKDKKNKSKVKCNPVDFNTFGTSIGIITNKIFHNDDTIAKSALDRLNVYREMSETDEKTAIQIRNEINKESPNSLFISLRI